MMTASKIKDRIVDEKRTTFKKPDDVPFVDFARKFRDSCNKQKTKDMYGMTINSLIKFTGDETVTFSQINKSFLRNYENWLIENKMKMNTRSIHLRNIRAVFNRAIDDDVINQDVYPFRNFKIKNEQREKQCLTAEQVRILCGYEFNRPALRMARDFWMLSFFLCGINY